MTHQIFLSYSRKDADLMKRVRDDLRAGISDLTVWTDEKIEISTPAWTRAIEKAIKDSIALVVILSPDAVESDWVGKEIAEAQRRGVRIFPLLGKGDPLDAIPIQINLTQFADIRDDLYDTGIKLLIAGLKQQIKRVAPSRPARTVPPPQPKLVPSKPKSAPKKVKPKKPEPHKLTIRKLSAWNPFDYIRLFWWAVIAVEKIERYKEDWGDDAFGATGAWLSSTAIWMVVFVPVLGANLEELTFTSNILQLTITPKLLLIGVVAGWAITLFLPDEDNIVSLTMILFAGLITFIAMFLLVKELSVITERSLINDWTFLLLLSVVLIGITGGNFSISGNINMVVFGVFLSITFGLGTGVIFGISRDIEAGFVNAIVAVLPLFLSWMLGLNFDDEDDYDLRHILRLSLFVLSYSLLIWYSLFGGWQAFA